jgi:hypothetical protein
MEIRLKVPIAKPLSKTMLIRPMSTEMCVYSYWCGLTIIAAVEREQNRHEKIVETKACFFQETDWASLTALVRATFRLRMTSEPGW